MEFPKAYSPQDYEEKIYALWEKSGVFAPKIDKKKKPFVMAMPPPNVTGKLHIGHAMFVTIEDILTRYHRMRGEPALWLPGTDHAGIATQAVVEKALKKEGLSRHKLGRKKFIERVWRWKREYGGEILEQIRALGASCDWSRERFTLDEGLSDAVKEAFVRLYKKGLIYRGIYIVNWCPRCHSAIADDEVEYVPQKTTLYFLKYDRKFPITIATTRPETKLGDVAVAVNPQDPRFAHYIGKSYEINLDGLRRRIKIIAERQVDMKFGTGAVGVTPAHSYVDWQMAEVNDLPIVKIIDEDGRITEEAGEKYQGLTVLEARKKLVEHLRKDNLIEKEEKIENNLSVCYRCETPIEPIPSKQWFVQMKPLVEPAVRAVESGQIKIMPERFGKVYFHWLENIRDWCISRQLWWGHRIPVWYRNSKLEIKNEKLKNWNLKIYGKSIFKALKEGKKTIEIRAGKPEGAEKYWGDFKAGDLIEFRLADEETDKIVESVKPVERTVKKVSHFKDFEELLEVYKPGYDLPGKNANELKEWWFSRPNFKERISRYGLWVFELLDTKKLAAENIYVGTTPPKGENWRQDPDVLDTWFSSALWPFSTLGWPKETADYRYFYPTTILETGYDILFFWVARMITMGLELTEKVPFKIVYLHGLVRDEHNRKMSKSLGNVLDPRDMSQKFGTDALRMALVIGATAGNDTAVGEHKIKGYRNFSNKIWNIARFVLTNLENAKFEKQNVKLSRQDQKDLKRLDEVVKQTTQYLDNFQFSLSGELLYNYLWHEFADKIIEEAKERLESDKELEKQAVIVKLLKILTACLKLLHPFAPFLTEVIWQKMPDEIKDSKLLISSAWPKSK